MIAHNLNSKQLQAVESPSGPLLIVAGAGSGKTRTLTARLEHLLASGIPPEQIIAITFTNKAADEMRTRVAHNISTFSAKGGRSSLGLSFEGSASGGKQLGREPFIGTFHSLGARILRKEAVRFGRTPKYTIYDGDDSLSCIRRSLKTLAYSPKEKIGPTLYRYYISKIKNELVAPEEIVDGNKAELLSAVYKAYESELSSCNAFDFDDLIEKPVRLFREHPAALKQYRERFGYILVDEFQDVNTSQYEFIKLLAKEHKNINAVGDDGQAIYGFRSANYKHFLNFERDWPEAKIVLLEENYRSTKTILGAANAIIANNKLQKPKSLWTQNKDGVPVEVREHEDEVAEAEWIASEIAKQFQMTNNLKPITNNAKPGGGESESAPVISNKLSVISNSTAVLYRTNSQSRPIEQAFIEHDIPYQIFGSIRFYERKEIKDVVACLRYAANPKDAVSFERMQKSLYAKQFRELARELPKKAEALPPYELIVYCINTANYFEYLKNNFPNAEERIENLEELMGFAQNYSNLHEFLEKVTLLQSSDNENAKKHAASGNVEIFKYLNIEPVRLMTIHIAKGLEFDKVFVAGVNEGLLPHHMSYGTPEELEEERRLMYVAITRAKHELALSFYDIGSRFLYEIPPELIKFSAEDGKNSELIDNEERYITFD